MSTKTLRKRIALVAVAALGAGVLATSPASAAAPDNNAVGAASISSTANVLNIATDPSVTGDAETSTSATSNQSRGLLANSTTQTTSSLTSTATVSASSEVVWYTTSDAATSSGDPIVTFVVDGGTISEAAGATTKVYNQALTSYSVGTEDTGGEVIAIGVTPKSGVTSYTVSMYTTLSTENAMTSTTATNVSPATIISGAQSAGSLVQRYTVTVASASESGTYSASNSYVQGSTTPTVAAASNVDASNSLKIANAASSVAYIAIALKDPYKVSLDSKGALVISATNGAGVFYDGGLAAGTPTNTTAVSIDTSGTITVARPTAYANKGFSTTVTITWNGTVVGTKTITFYGEVSKIVASHDAYNLQAGATSSSSGGITYVDDAGNVLTPTSGTSVVSTSLNQYITAASVDDWADSTDTTSYYGVTCAGTATTGKSAGSADLVFQHVNEFSGSTIKSAAVKVTCSGNPVTYTAALDKAIYAPGDIATLTITGKDLQGALAQGTANLIQSTVSGSEFTITASQMTPVTAISTTSVKLSSGVGYKTYKFVVGNTEGSYNAVVAIPLINALVLGGANQTVAYKVVAPSTGAVSNADVLKAIVSLIASINKQIAALQKALLKK